MKVKEVDLLGCSSTMAAFKEPLYLPTPDDDEERKETEKIENVLRCLLCEEQFAAAKDQDLLKHLLESHNFVIEDVPSIADLPAYCRFVMFRFIEN